MPGSFLTDNALTGTIPDTIGNMKTLSDLYVLCVNWSILYLSLLFTLRTSILIFTVSYPSINWQGQFLRVLAISSNYRNCTSQPYVIVFIVCFNVHDPNYSNLYGITDYTP